MHNAFPTDDNGSEGAFSKDTECTIAELCGTFVRYIAYFPCVGWGPIVGKGRHYVALISC